MGPGSRLVMDRHNNLLLVLIILTNFYVNCCAWAQLDSLNTETLEATGTYTDTIEATGTPAAGQSSSDGDLLSLRLHQHAYRQ